jgi:hypothetical protein
MFLLLAFFLVLNYQTRQIKQALLAGGFALQMETGSRGLMKFGSCLSLALGKRLELRLSHKLEAI